jgi:hypothetical protein
VKDVTGKTLGVNANQRRSGRVDEISHRERYCLFGFAAAGSLKSGQTKMSETRWEISFSDFVQREWGRWNGSYRQPLL